MPLTRNLYELDEVISALQICLRRNLPAAHFWTWELIQSSEENLALQTLQQTWLEYGGCRDPTLLNITPSDSASWCILTLRVRFACRTRTPALPLLNEAAISEPPVLTIPAKPQPTPKLFLVATSSESIDLKLATRIWKYLHAALAAKNRPAVMWALQAMQPLISSDTIWLAIEALTPSTITQLLRAHASPHPESQILHQANALLIACIAEADLLNFMSLPEEAPAVENYIRAWSCWTPGHRASRIHEIPIDALHRETTRGRIPFRYTNIDDIRDPIGDLPNGCRWWREKTATMGIYIDEEGALVCPSDDVLEIFHERYFPDDIPDEWSAKDQQKSHGRGVAETAPEPPPALKIREEPFPISAWILSVSAVEEISTNLSMLVITTNRKVDTAPPNTWAGSK